MKLGIVSDTHEIGQDIITKIVTDLKFRGAEIIIHCGDIESQHIDSELFLGMPVVCVLTKEQRFRPEFVFPPKNWCYVRSGSIENRIVNLGDVRIYAGHERSADVFRYPERLNEFVHEVRQLCDGVRMIFTGHTHHQFLIQRGPITWINPGAVNYGFDGHEYALVDTTVDEVVFCRLPKSQLAGLPQTIGIITDTGNITQRDRDYWRQLACEFNDRDAKTIIHCGNIWPGDIGREELDGFQVYYNLLPDQVLPDDVKNYANWHLIPPDRPVVDFANHRFVIQYDLGNELATQSEWDAHLHAQKLCRQYHNVDFLLCGLNTDTLYQENGHTLIINPGDARIGRNFATCCFPKKELTFSKVRT